MMRDVISMYCYDMNPDSHTQPKDPGWAGLSTHHPSMNSPSLLLPVQEYEYYTLHSVVYFGQ